MGELFQPDKFTSDMINQYLCEECVTFSTLDGFLLVVADVTDGGLSDVMKDVDVTETDLKIRRRPAAVAAEKKPPPHSPLNIQTPKSKTTTSDNTKEATAVWDTHTPAETEEETSPGPRSDTSTVAGPVLENVVDFQLRITDDAPHNEMEVVQDNDGFLMEPELVRDENREEEEEVSTQENLITCQFDIKSC